MYSFGPLGFLRAPSYAYPWTTRLAFAYTFAVQFALCLALLWVLRRNFGSLLVAAPIALVIATLVFAEPVPVLVFAVAVGLVRREFPSRLVPAILAATGALVAVQLLAKLSTGVCVAALCMIALLAAEDRRRQAAWFGGGLTLALSAGWALAGQSFAAIPSYLSGSLQVISGYSESMGLEAPGGQWELGAALVLAAMGALTILRADALSPSRVRLATMAMWLVLAFTAFKAGFVRHESNHANVFFGSMLGGLAALPLLRLPRSTSLLILLFATMALLASFRVSPTDLLDPAGRASDYVEQLRTLTDGSATNAEIVRSRGAVARAYAVDPTIVAALRGRTVHVEPYDTSVLWANSLSWKPVPTFQSYVAYTADLDARNAAAFASPDGPERVLRRVTAAVDGRNPAWESPAAIRAMLCNFRATVNVAPWQVLARTSNRCGRPRLLQEARARMGESIVVAPSPDRRSVVYMEVDGVAVAGLERLVTMLYRAKERHVTLGGRPAFRLVPGTAADGLIMRVPEAIDFPTPLSLDQGAETVVVTRAGAQSGDDVRVRFYAVTVQP